MSFPQHDVRGRTHPLLAEKNGVITLKPLVKDLLMATALARDFYLSGHEYRGCYALPLLRTNAHILRLPFEL